MIVNNIKYIDPPRPGGKYGGIKDANGVKIHVPPDLLLQFRLGMTCEISTKQQTWNAGTPDEKVVTIATSGPTGPVQAQGVQAGYQAANQGPANQRPNTGFQPRVVQGGPALSPQTDQTRWNFIMGLTGRWGSSGKFTVSEMRILGREAAALYDELGKPPANLRERADAAWTEPATNPVPGLEPGDPGPELQ